jgi:hypothetical protein
MPNFIHNIVKSLKSNVHLKILKYVEDKVLYMHILIRNNCRILESMAMKIRAGATYNLYTWQYLTLPRYRMPIYESSDSHFPDLYLLLYVVLSNVRNSHREAMKKLCWRKWQVYNGCNIFDYKRVAAHLKNWVESEVGSEDMRLALSPL